MLGVCEECGDQVHKIDDITGLCDKCSDDLFRPRDPLFRARQVAEAISEMMAAQALVAMRERL